MGAGRRTRRLVARGVGVAVLATGAVVAPVATLPAPAAHPVAPHVQRHGVAGRIDPGALQDPTALRTADGHAAGTGRVVLPERLRAAARATGASSAPERVGDGELAVLGTKTLTAHFLVGGITWAPGGPDVVEADARVREDGTWSDWFALDVDDLGVAGERPGTDPIVTGGADGVQVRLVTADGTAPADVRVDVVDPGTSAADATVGAGLGTPEPAATADASTGYEIEPSIVTRAQWGADESRGGAWPDVSAKLQAMYVHHTAGTNTYTRAQSAAIVRGIYAFHTGSRGWPDIGYQFLVDKYGTIYQGRRDAIYDNPVGAQAGGYNTGTIGVSAMGDYDTARPSAALLTGIEKVLAWKGYEYGVDSLGTVRLLTGGSTGSKTKAKAGTYVTKPTILGHRDTNGTACPGRYLYAKLPTIRKAVHARIAAARKKYGAVRYTTAAPAIVTATPAQAPVQWSGTTTYSWKAVAGAKKYQVLTRSASRGTSAGLTDTRYWTVLRTVTTTHADIATSSGTTRLVAVRAVDGTGRLGPAAKVAQTTRPVSSSTVHRSASWKNVAGDAYYRDAAWRSTSSTASLSVTGLVGVRQVVVRAATGPGSGRLEVRTGTRRLGVLDLGALPASSSASLVLPLSQAVAGTITLVALDKQPKLVSALAFPRIAASSAVGVSHAARASTPSVVALPASAAVQLGTAQTYTWKAAENATRYEVWARTAAHGKGFGAWHHVATTTATRYRLATTATGTTWDVAVRAVGPGGSSAFAHYRTVTRPVSSALVHRSSGWAKRSDGRYYRDRAWVTTHAGATLTVTKAKSVKRVRLVVRAGPGEGRVAVYVGGKKVGTRATAAARTTWAQTIDVVLPSARSGTVVVKTLDHKPVRISAVALARS